MLPTDEQVIDRIRRWQRYRRPVGAICFVLGLAGLPQADSGTAGQTEDEAEHGEGAGHDGQP